MLGKEDWFEEVLETPVQVRPDMDPATIARSLESLVDGEVLYSEWERAMYATDASSYEMMPLCVVLPRSKDDVVKVVSYAAEKRIAVIARGGGSGVVGQAIGTGIILDFTKYMNEILDFDPDENFVVVQPGIYKSRLDAFLRKEGKFLPPDPSSSDYCTVGGMIANNGCGPHTVKYGATIDYLLSLEIVLSDGTLVKTGHLRLDSDEWRNTVGKGSLESKIYLEVRRIVEENSARIREKVPKVRKNSSGYRLERVLDDGIMDLGKLIVSSEGTLAIVVEAKFRVLDLPRNRGLSLLYFDDFGSAGRATSELLKLSPSAIELLDYRILNLARSAYPEIGQRIPDYLKALLVVEFDDETTEEIGRKIVEVGRLVEKGLARSSSSSTDPVEMKRLWEVRKKALPLAFKTRSGDRRPTSFIEDTIVETSRLGEYLECIYSVYERHGIEGVIFGHAGDGHIHTRPLLDLKSADDIQMMRKVADELFGVVKGFGGSITGEHGDGLARSDYVKMLYGDEVYELFRQVKRIFDPNNIMNPGKKVILDEEADLLTKNLRYGVTYERRPITTELNWGIEGNRLIQRITGYSKELSYESEVELCHGCGGCRENSYAARMCPVFKAFGDEVDSCRGRNNLLRWMLKKTGLDEEFQFDDRYGDAIYKHCIQCKMCQIDCPSSVNVAKLMAEARARYARVKGLPKGYKFFMDIDRYAEWGHRLAPLSNTLFSNRIFRLGLEFFAHLDRHRNLPPFSRLTFPEVFAEHRGRSTDRGERSRFEREAVFFYDTYVCYNNPSIGMDVVRMLEVNGVKVLVPPQKSSGLPAIVEGDLETAKRIVEYNVGSLSSYAAKSLPIITFSPSAGIALKMDYLSVLDNEKSRLVAENTYDIHEYLHRLAREGSLKEMKPLNREVSIHLHCHTLAQKVEGDVLKILGMIPGMKTRVMEAGCCGVGGSFSFIKGNFDMSLAMGRELFDAVADSRSEVYTTGESCMLQMSYGSRRKVGLTVELLAESMLDRE